MATNDTTGNMGNEFPYFNLPFAMICILGVVSNVLLLVAFIKDPLKCFRNSGTYLVMNLAVSDCIMSLLCLIVEIVPGTSSFFPLLCVAFWMGAVSCLSITSISIDRFFMIASPIKHRILIKGKVMILWISATWILGCVIPVFLMLSTIHRERGSQALGIVAVICCILSAVMYSSTYYKLKTQSRNIALQNSTEGRAQEIRILKEKRFLNTIILIACTSFVCTVPFFLLYFLRKSLGFLVYNPQVLIIFLRVFTCIFEANFTVNPLIYILRLPNYRKTFCLLYCRRRAANSS